MADYTGTWVAKEKTDLIPAGEARVKLINPNAVAGQDYKYAIVDLASPPTDLLPDDTVGTDIGGGTMRYYKVLNKVNLLVDGAIHVPVTPTPAP